MAGISGANEGENNTEQVKERKRDVEQNEQRVINGHGKDDVANTEKCHVRQTTHVSKFEPKNIACVNISLFVAIYIILRRSLIYFSKRYFLLVL
jgi:hypothetical protein